MSEEFVTPQEAKAIKKKITMTVFFLILAALGTGAALFVVAKPAHASAEQQVVTYEEVKSARLMAVAKAEHKSTLGESIDFSTTLLSLRSRAAQESLSGSYRPLRPTFAEQNIDINRAYDAPIATTQVRRAVVEEKIDERMIKRGKDEEVLIKRESTPKPSGAISGAGSARIAATARLIPDEFAELFAEVVREVKTAEQLWQSWVDGDRSTESNKQLGEAKTLLISARDAIRVIRASNLDIDELDYVFSYVSTMIYDINKSNIGGY